MNLTIFKVFIFLFGVLLGLTAQAETLKLDFEKIPELVRIGNLHSQGAELLRKSAEQGDGYLGRSYLPRLSAELGTESFKTGTQKNRSEPYGSLNARMNLYRGGKDGLEDDIVDARIKMAGADSERILREELRKARSLYWHLVSQREIAQLLDEATLENEKNLKSAQSRIRAGAGTETDRIEFEMYKLELAQDLARLRLANENTERDLVVLLGLKEGTRIETELVVGHEHKDELLVEGFAPDSHPLVSSLKYQGIEAQARSIQEGRWWAPSLDLYAGYGLHTYREREFEPESERYESVVGVQLTMQLFDGLLASAEQKQKSLQAAGLQKESLQSSLEMNSKIIGARNELKLTHELIHQSEEALLRAKTYMSRTLDEYRRGVKNSPDVLNASERNISIRRRFAELRRDYQLARCELLEIIGK